MKTLRVTIDGDTRTTASISEGTVAFMLSAGHHPDGEERPTYLKLGGQDDKNRLRWLDIDDLQVGTCIQLEILECDDVDDPDRLPIEPDRMEQNDREQYEWAKEIYFKLKNKFET